MSLPAEVRADSQNRIQPTTLKQFKETLSQKNQSYAVTFMASWCTPCKEELPLLIKMNRKYKAQKLRFIGLSVDYAGPEPMQPVIEKYQVDFPVYWIGESAIDAFEIQGIPILLLIRNGTIEQRIAGTRPERELEELLRIFLEKN
jgi:thiol-disulfide isomerase/thioredoxin